jgi:formylglycine-generating enzyme required for sulfatase activity
MRSEQELREAAGYANRPADFEDLLRILDTELRLITPTDPEGSFTLDGTRQPSPVRYYQLTHDYLVHSLQDWLTRKQRETRRGRAELLLTDRAAFWMARPENRHLPSPWEWATIELQTRRRDWNEAQRLMMRRAGARHGTRALVLSIALACAVVTGLTAWHASIGAALVPRLLSADIAKVPQIVSEMHDYHRWTDPELKRTLTESSDTNVKLRASLALLDVDPNQLDYLTNRLSTSTPAELPVLRDALERHRITLIPVLWNWLETKQPGEAEILPAASALARYAPSDAKWDRVGDKIAVTLSSVNPVFLGPWIEALKPLSHRLTQPLARIFRDPQRSDLDRSHVANILADYAADDQGLLALFTVDAEPRDFPALFSLASRRPSIAVPVWASELRKPYPVKKPNPASNLEAEKDRLAERQARAAIGLIRLGESRDIWPLLAHGPDPRLRSFILNWLKPLGVNAESVVAEFQRLDARPRPVRSPYQWPLVEMLFDSETSMRRSLILALGTYGRDEVSSDVRDALVSRLLALYSTDPDPGIHGASAWTLRQWGAHEPLGKLDAAVRDKGPVGRWFVNSQGQTFVVLGDHLEFAMGSPEGEHGRRPQELQHTRSIERRFAIAAHEVTVAQFKAFLDSSGQGERHKADGRSPEPTGPANALTWYEAAEYCNWLSRVEGLSEVYEPDQNGRYAERMRIRADALKRNGYRLPTEAEWEYACRAGTRTSRYYGNSPSLLRRYAWFVDYGAELLKPCGSLMPNDLGMFDMLGNTYEWCMGRALDYKPDQHNRLPDTINEAEIVLDSNSRVIRGGSFADRPEESRSAYRDRESPKNRYMTYGFRPARTYP